jgi:hypothetical protein
MKKLRILIPVGLFLVAGLIFVACQKDAPLRGEKKVMATCECVNEIVPATATVLGGGSNPSQIGQIKIWNDASNVYIEVGTFQYDNIKLVGFLETTATTPENATFNSNTVSSSPNQYWKGTYAIGTWDFCSEKRFFIKVEGKAGGTATYTIDYELQELCPQGCDDELTPLLVCGPPNTFTVTFKAGEAGDYVIQGGLNAKVDGDLVTWDATKGDFNLGHQSVLNSNSNVIRWEGTLVECEEVTITVTFSGKCETGEWTAKLQ